ncbi:Uncharacterized protein APZ42_024844 [Daphnia magna]|uniref:EGF-like domain-containing protein n=1 Tax=Daphnia magna TaxID=35525 RepID=A0A164TR60_9CRUS|nr:Uncharacterized protein APZ42_024844 [Daphnia magna]
MEPYNLLRWIVFVLVFVELPTTAEGARLRKPMPIPISSWQRQACDAKEGKQVLHFTCTPDGQLQCFEGWIGDLCNVPICKKGCDPLNGHCKAPGECRCKLGFSGELCRDCALLPGCVHGTCNKSFECQCKPGWTGLFCSQGTDHSMKNQQVANRKLLDFLSSFRKSKPVQ